MNHSVAEITTERASIYLQQLCKHFAHKLAVEFTPEQGVIPFSMGTCRLEAVGDKLTLKVETGIVRLIGPGDVVVGQLEPKIAQRVMRLVKAGNRYSAAITSIDDHHVRIILREEYRDPSMRSRPSFPTQRNWLVPSAPLSNIARASAAARSRSSGWTTVSQKLGVESHSSTV